MKNHRLLTELLLACFALILQAQTQPGYVKSLGRQNQKGVALSGVSIRAKGAHNAVLSQENGTFSMNVKGTSYVLQQVQKSGYELNEKGMIGRNYAYSATVPLTIVMVSTQQLQADKQRIENKAYQTAERNYKRQIALLEKQKADNVITIEQYRQQIRDLQDKFDKYQSLIESLADHYAHTDYDGLNEKEREINICIENGNLGKADTLLQQLGIHERIASIERRLAAGQSLMDQATQDLAAVLKQQDKDAEHLYQLYTIRLGRFDYKEAQKYIEIRADLDTTNLQWQLDAGNFVFEYLMDYSCARVYYQRVLNSGKDDSAEIADAYESMGALFAILGQNEKSREYTQKALHIAEKLYGKNHRFYAECCVGMGAMYTSQNEYKEGLKWLETALPILLENYGEKHANVALCYAHMGNNYLLQSKFKKGEECYEKALEIRKAIYPRRSPVIARNYSHLAALYLNNGNGYTAELYCQWALEILQSCFGEPHHAIATLYYSMGQASILKQDYNAALKWFKKSLDNYKAIFGENHSDVATCYLGVGQAYCYKEDYKSALKCFDKALSIQRKTVGDTHPNVGKTWECYGYLYYMKGNTKEALRYYRKALDVYKQTLGEKHPSTKAAHKVISQMKIMRGLSALGKGLQFLNSI